MRSLLWMRLKIRKGWLWEDFDGCSSSKIEEGRWWSIMSYFLHRRRILLQWWSDEEVLESRSWWWGVGGGDPSEGGSISVEDDLDEEGTSSTSFSSLESSFPWICPNFRFDDGDTSFSTDGDDGCPDLQWMDAWLRRLLSIVMDDHHHMEVDDDGDDGRK